jgi:hypothetical protein
MSRLSYLVAGLVVGGITFLLAQFFAPNLTGFINQAMGGARPFLGEFVVLIGEPIKLILANPLIGAVVVAVAWPIALLLYVMLIVLTLIALGGGTVLSLSNEAGALLNR